MKESDRIAAEHEKNGTDPFDDPAFVAAVEAEDDVPIEGTQWDPDWVHSPTHRGTSSTSK